MPEIDRYASDFRTIGFPLAAGRIVEILEGQSVSWRGIKADVIHGPIYGLQIIDKDKVGIPALFFSKHDADKTLELLIENEYLDYGNEAGQLSFNEASVSVKENDSTDMGAIGRREDNTNSDSTREGDAVT